MFSNNAKYQNNSDNPRIFPQVNSKDGIYFAMLFTLRDAPAHRNVGVRSGTASISSMNESVLETFHQISY